MNIKDAIEMVSDLLMGREPKEITKDFKTVFGTPQGKRVLSYLRDYCGANRTSWRDDAREHAFFEGQRVVWLQIAFILSLTPEEIEKLTPEEAK